MKNDLLYLIALKKTPLVGDVTAKKLIAHFGSAESVFGQRKEILEKVSGIGKKIAHHLFSSQYLHEAEAELRFAEQHNLRIVSYADADYPFFLKQCVDSPVVYYQRGNIQLQNKRLLAIVGTRHATHTGMAFCEQLVEALAPLGVVVVSGYAYGIDITAHKAAMKNRLQTVACLAHGLNFMYPPAHQKYCDEMEENGGFITDFGYQSPFDRKNFLSRNRIIAGLSEATVVIESGSKGGSLVTADLAFSYGREVFAVPGRPNDVYSLGCNHLLQSHKAHLLLSAEDLIKTLKWDTPAPQAVQQELFVSLTPEEQLVADYLHAHGKQTLDNLSLGCELPINLLTNLLFQLEIKGVVTPLPGKVFEVR